MHQPVGSLKTFTSCIPIRMGKGISLSIVGVVFTLHHYLAWEGVMATS